MSALRLHVRFLDYKGEIVKRVSTPVLRAPAGSVTGRLVCDGHEQPFDFNLPARSTTVDVDVDYRPRGQILKEYSVVKVRGSERVADKMKYAARSPVPVELEVWLGGESVFYCRPASWS